MIKTKTYSKHNILQLILLVIICLLGYIIYDTNTKLNMWRDAGHRWSQEIKLHAVADSIEREDMNNRLRNQLEKLKKLENCNENR